MTVTPPISARTSSRRFTLLNVASAATIASFATPWFAASAAAAVAFSALCSPASCIASSAQSAPPRHTSQRVTAVLVAQDLRICQSARF